MNSQSQPPNPTQPYQRDQDEPMTPAIETVQTPNFNENSTQEKLQVKKDKPKMRQPTMLVEDEIDLMGPLRITQQQNQVDQFQSRGTVQRVAYSDLRIRESPDLPRRSSRLIIIDYNEEDHCYTRQCEHCGNTTEMDLLEIKRHVPDQDETFSAMNLRRNRSHSINHGRVSNAQMGVDMPDTAVSLRRFSSLTSRTNQSNTRTSNSYFRRPRPQNILQSVNNVSRNLKSQFSKQKPTQSKVSANIIQVYFGGNHVKPITDNEAAYANKAFKPFMTYWRRFFKAASIAYLSLLFLAVQIFNVKLIWDMRALDYNELQNNKEEDADPEYYDFDEWKLREVKAAFIILALCMFVTNYVTYRAHLVTIQAFKSIKMQNMNVEGFQYSKFGRCLNLLFIFSQSYKMRYDEYVAYIKRYESVYVTRSLAAQFTFVGAILAFDLIQPYQIEELKIHVSYYALLVAFAFPQIIFFFIKVAIFPWIFALHRMFMCIDVTCCGRKKFPMARSISEDLEIDVGYVENGVKHYEHKRFYESTYLSECQLKFAKCVYPFRQWLHLMMKDKNPAQMHQVCQLCNESFELFDTIVLPLQCRSREEGSNVEPHYFHICCVDIIGLENDKQKESKFKSECESFRPNLDCIACNLLQVPFDPDVTRSMVGSPLRRSPRNPSALISAMSKFSSQKFTTSKKHQLSIHRRASSLPQHELTQHSEVRVERSDDAASHSHAMQFNDMLNDVVVNRVKNRDLPQEPRRLSLLGSEKGSNIIFMSPPKTKPSTFRKITEEKKKQDKNSQFAAPQDLIEEILPEHLPAQPAAPTRQFSKQSTTPLLIQQDMLLSVESDTPSKPQINDQLIVRKDEMNGPSQQP